MIVKVLISPNVCFCTTWVKQNRRNITFSFKAVWSLNEVTHIKHILSRFMSLWLTVYPTVCPNCLQKMDETSALCVNTGMQMLSPFFVSSVDNVLLQTSTMHAVASWIRRLVDLLLHDTAKTIGVESGLLVATVRKFIDVFLLISTHISFVLFMIIFLQVTMDNVAGIFLRHSVLKGNRTPLACDFLFASLYM